MGDLQQTQRRGGGDGNSPAGLERGEAIQEESHGQGEGSFHGDVESQGLRHQANIPVSRREHDSAECHHP